MSKIPRTVCPFCNLGCELGFEVKAGDVRRVEYVSDSRNQARLCPKGNASAQIVNHRSRLYHPLIKGRQASLAQASDYLRRRLVEFNPDEVLVVYDASLTTEEMDSLLAWAGGAGYKNLAHVTSGTESAFIYGEPPKVSLQDITTGDYAFIVGDAFGQDSVISGYIGKAKGDKRDFRYIVADAFETNTSHFAHRFVRVRPGCEGLFLYGLYKHIAEEKADFASIAQESGVEVSTFEDLASILRNKDGILVNAPARGRSFDPFLTHAAAVKLSRALESMIYVPLGPRIPPKVTRSFFSYLPMIMGARIKSVLSFGVCFPWDYPQLRPVFRKVDFVAAGTLFIPDGRFGLELVLPMASELEKEGSIRTLFGEAKVTGAAPGISGTLAAGEYFRRMGDAGEPLESPGVSFEALDDDAIDERIKALISAKPKPAKDRDHILLGAQSAIGFYSFFEQENWVKLNPQDASMLGIKAEDTVGIQTEQGEAELVAKVWQGIPADTAVVSMNHKPSVALFELATDSGTGDGFLKPTWSKIWKK